MINYILNRPSRKDLNARIDGLQSSVLSREAEVRLLKNHNQVLEAKLKQCEMDLEDAKELGKSKAKDFEFLQSQLNDTLVQVRTTLKDKLAILDRTVQLNYDLRKQLIEVTEVNDRMSEEIQVLMAKGTEKPKRKYVRKEAKK